MELFGSQRRNEFFCLEIFDDQCNPVLTFLGLISNSVLVFLRLSSLDLVLQQLFRSNDQEFLHKCSPAIHNFSRGKNLHISSEF